MVRPSLLLVLMVPLLAFGARRTSAQQLPSGMRGWSIAAHERACDAGAGNACYRLAKMFAEGDGVTKDLDRAKQVFEKGCDSGATLACDAMIELFEKEGPAHDVAKAGEFRKRAAQTYDAECAKGDAYACLVKGFRSESAAGMKPSADYYAKACGAGNATACWRGGYAYGSGDGVQRDEDRATQLYAKSAELNVAACDLGDRLACTNAGLLFGESGTWFPKKDLPRALALLNKACDAKHAQACDVLGYWYHHGQGVPKDEAKAFPFLSLACEGDRRTACATLGYYYHRGKGVNKDLAKSAAMYLKACGLGHDDSCSALATSELKKYAKP
jgi:uncharacterized protein